MYSNTTAVPITNMLETCCMINYNFFALFLLCLLLRKGVFKDIFPVGNITFIGIFTAIHSSNKV